MSWNIKRRRRSERGAVTVLFAILVVVIFAVAALGVDIAQQVNRKHLLINQLDSAATAAAANLGAENGSIAAAVEAAADYFANSGQGELDLTRSTSGVSSPASSTATTARSTRPWSRPPRSRRPPRPGAPNPDAVGGETGKWSADPLPEPSPVLRRPTVLDVVQRHPLRGPVRTPGQDDQQLEPGQLDVQQPADQMQHDPGRRRAGRSVPFAGVMGINEGSTGLQISVACAGSVDPSRRTRWTSSWSPTAPSR